MIQFKISVPGTLSLFGEHAVTHNKAGLMGTIDLRTTLTFEETSNSDIIFHVTYPHIRLELDIPLERFLAFYNHCVQDIESLNGKVLQCLANVYESPNHTMIVHAYLYLFIYIAYKEQIEIKAFKMQLSTEFLVYNEFACPATITVCLVICFLNWSRLQKGFFDIFNAVNCSKIWAYVIHYEQVSSQSRIIDVFTCISASLMQYRNECITRIVDGLPSMTILLVDSKEQKPYLDAQVQRVAMNMVPQMAHSIFNSINDLMDNVCNIFQSLVDISKNTNLDSVSRLSRTSAQIKLLETCARINESLLKSLNVSLPHVDNICLTAEKYGMCGKRADNGRFVYIWCPEHVDESCTHMKRLTDELTMQDFHVTESKFDHEGIKLEPL